MPAMANEYCLSAHFSLLLLKYMIYCFTFCCLYRIIWRGISSQCWSQWPCGLRYELSSLARKLVSRFRIPLKAWVSLGTYSVFVVSFVQVAAFRWTDSPSKKSYLLCTDQETEKAAKVQKGCRAIDKLLLLTVVRVFQGQERMHDRRRLAVTSFTQASPS
jgi:hypothetical protein